MKFKNIKSMVVALCATALISCETTSETFAEFSTIPEVIYIGKADSVMVSHGYEELELGIRFNSDPKITAGMVLIDGTDSSKFEITRKNDGVDTAYHKFAIPEGQYSLAVYMLDDDGNKSVSKEVAAISYGPNYQSVLLARKVNSVSIASDSLSVKWATADPVSGIVSSQITYPDASGSTVTVVVPNDETETKIGDFQAGRTLEVQSFYHPTESAYYDFPSEVDEHAIPE
ncbi:DUF4998 domain-containing protein [Marinoscillum furvescens]|nr:DUF4998 domain-containing protein [Marinoscillum furvescens]